MNFTAEQRERYSRNMALEEVGEAGQAKLLAGRVLVVGAGGLGSPAAFYLVAAGVGTIGIIDSDVLDRSNLQRQILHSTNHLGQPKVHSAEARLRALNPDVRLIAHFERLTAAHALDIIRPYDFVLDCTDNFESKFLIADVCHAASKPCSQAGIVRFEGQMMTVDPGKTACYRCVFDAPPPPGAVPTSAETGVMGVVPGVIGTMQATEAIKFLLGVGTLMTNVLLVYQALDMTFRRVPLKRNPRCPLCSPEASRRLNPAPRAD